MLLNIIVKERAGVAGDPASGLFYPERNGGKKAGNQARRRFLMDFPVSAKRLPCVGVRSGHQGGQVPDDILAHAVHQVAPFLG